MALVGYRCFNRMVGSWVADKHLAMDYHRNVFNYSKQFRDVDMLDPPPPPLPNRK